MGKLILLIVLGLAVGFYFPDTRAMLFEKGGPVLHPVLEWNATREIEQIMAALQDMENVERRLPQRGEYVRWLGETFTADVQTDPWGSVYGYEVKEDSFAIVSNGPDRTIKTADDIRDVRIRNWRAKGNERRR